MLSPEPVEPAAAAPSRRSRPGREPGVKPGPPTPNFSRGATPGDLMELVGEGWEFISGVCDVYIGSEWKLTDDEISRLAPPTAKVLSKIQKVQQLDKYKDEIALLMVALAIFGPRLLALQNNGGLKNIRKQKTESGEYDNGYLAGETGTTGAGGAAAPDLFTSDLYGPGAR